MFQLQFRFISVFFLAENVSFPCKIESNRIFTISATGLFFLVVYIIQRRDSLARNDKRKKKKVLNRILSNRREKKVFSSLQTITARKDIYIFFFVGVVKRPRKTDVRQSDGGTVTHAGIGRVKRCSLQCEV